MIFSIQRYVEDYAARRSLNDPDQYSVKLANLYDAERSESDSDADFLNKMHRIRTSFFISNGLDRSTFERQFLTRLDRKFKKKISRIEPFPGGVKSEKSALNKKPRSIGRILEQFKKGVEARAIDSFWESRQKGKLQSKPEKIGQSLIALFISGVLDGKGLVFREMGSGIGFVDIVVLLSRTPHLIELKMLKGKLSGVSQLQTYMRTEDREAGWLVLFDCRPVASRSESIPAEISLSEGLVNIIVVDINPVPPSKS